MRKSRLPISCIIGGPVAQTQISSFKVLKHKYQVLNFNTKNNIIHYICQCAVHAMQRNFMNTPYTFPVMKENVSICCFEHITLNNLIRHKATKNKQWLKSRMSDHHWPSLTIISAKSLMIAYIIAIRLMEYSIKI